MDEYVNNYEYAESAVDPYDTYTSVELNSSDANGNALYGRVKKLVRNNDRQSAGIVNRSPLIDTIKYEVEYLDGYIE